MKHLFIFFTFLITVTTINGQAPTSFKYQAVLRDSRSNTKANTATNISIDILQGSATGTSVYSETHRVTTEGSGLINLDLGTGTVVSGSMANINWATGIYFLKISVDGVIMSTSQLLSVPYALYSSKAANGFNDNGAVKKLTIAGGKLKETGFTHRLSPNTGATNESGFTALPGGLRNFDGSFGGSGGGMGEYWGTTGYTLTNAGSKLM